MKKFRLHFDKDKEERWLNEMSQKGWAMVEYFAGLYVFVPCKPGEYTYRVDMPEDFRSRPSWKKNRENNREYISLVEETGAEYVCGWGWWIFFRKETAKGGFELYTDIESQVALYQRIRRLFLMLGVFECCIAFQHIANTILFFATKDDLNSLSGADMFLMVCLVSVCFLVAGVIGAFLMMCWKLTRKIRDLQK